MNKILRILSVLFLSCTAIVAAAQPGNPNPPECSYFTVSGGGAVCGATAVSVTLSGSSNATNYQLRRNGTNVGSPVAGTGSPLVWTGITTAGTYTVYASDGFNCADTMTGSATVTTGTVPTVFNLTGFGTFCVPYNTYALLSLSGSQTGVQYRYFIDGVNPCGGDCPVNGTGNPFNNVWGARGTNVAVTMEATHVASGCKIMMNPTGSGLITTKDEPQKYNVTGGGVLCTGDAAGKTVSLSNSQTGMTYQLKRDGSNVGTPKNGTGAQLDWTTNTTAGTYTIEGTNTNGGCTTAMNSSVTITLKALPTVFNVTGNPWLCGGSSSTVLSLSGSQTNTSYQIFRDGVLYSTSSGNGSPKTIGSFPVGTYTVTAVSQSGAPNCTQAMNGTIVVTSIPDPQQFTLTGGGTMGDGLGSFCTSDAGPTLTLSGSEVGVNYQLIYNDGTDHNDGTPKAGTGGAISWTDVRTTGNHYVKASTANGSCPKDMLGLRYVRRYDLPPIANVIIDNGTQCFDPQSVKLDNTDNNFWYDLYLGDGEHYDGPSATARWFPTESGFYTVRGHQPNAPANCFVQMNGIADFSYVAQPTFEQLFEEGFVCGGAGGVSIVTGSSDINVNYQLFRDGLPVGPSQPGDGYPILWSQQKVPGIYTATATPYNSSCSITLFGEISIEDNPLPAAFNLAGGGSLCPGVTSLSVSTTSSETTASYFLERDGLSIGDPVVGTGEGLTWPGLTTAGTYTVYAIHEGVACGRSSTNSVTIVAGTAPTVYNVTGGGNFTFGSTGPSVTLSNSQSGYTYQAKWNGVNSGTPKTGTGSALTWTNQNNPGTYTIVATSPTGCSANMNGGATVTMNYPVLWADKAGVTDNSGVLTKTAASGFWTNAYAQASNVLDPNTDGWIQFTVTSQRSIYIGFAIQDAAYTNTTFANAIFINSGSGRVDTNEGATTTTFTNIVNNDVLRISREGSQMKYYRNGTVFRTVTVDPSLKLVPRALIYFVGNTTPAVVSNINARPVIRPIIIGTGGTVASGTINTTILGATAPFTYLWDNATTGANLINASFGPHTVTVTDALGRTNSETFNVGYKVRWPFQTGVTEDNDVLTKTAANGFGNSGGVSTNIFPANTDGWIEFFGGVGGYVIGFAVDERHFNTSLQHGLYLSSSAGFAFSSYEGNTNTPLGTWLPTDLFRIERVGTQVMYFKNGALLRTVTTNNTQDVKLRASINNQTYTVSHVNASFDSQIVPWPTFTPVDPSGNNGSISLSPKGGTAPFTYNWGAHGTQSQITGKAKGAYPVTITDALGRTKTTTLSLGYRTGFVYTAGVSENAGVLTKTAVDSWTNASATTSNAMAATENGALEFTITDPTSTFVVGYTINELRGQNDFNHAIYINGSFGTHLSIENGVTTDHGTVIRGDLFKIERSGSSVNLYRNGTLFKTQTVASTNVEFRAKISMFNQNGVAPYLNPSFDARVIPNALITPTAFANSGGVIAVAPTGGVAPYTITWPDGVHASPYSNLQRTTNTIRVTDAQGRFNESQYRVGYKVNWVNPTGVTISNGTLTKTAANGWGNAGAYSTNILEPNTDGWMEFVAGTGNYYLAGFAAQNLYTNADLTHGIIIHSLNGTYACMEGAASTVFPTYLPGDVFRISREGSQMKFYRNGVVVRTVSTNAALALKAKVAMYYVNSVTPVFTTSFDSKIGAASTVAGTNYVDGSGTITTTANSGGTAPYSYLWQSTETTNTVADKPRGNQSLTVTDAEGRQLTSNYYIGYRPFWKSLTNVSELDGVLTKTTGASAWGAGAVSSPTLAANANGYIEFVARTGDEYIIGFGTSGTWTNTSFNWAINVSTNGAFYSYELSNQVLLGAITDGDVLRIDRNGTTVRYYRNGVAVRTLTGVNANVTVNAKAVISAIGQKTPPITTSFWIPASEGNVPDIAEFNALKDLYTSTVGTGWTTKTNWPTTWPASATPAQMGTWFGVTVASNDITSVSLNNNHLVGPLPPRIGELQGLGTLSLNNNNSVSGTIPASLRYLNKLTNLSCSVCSFTGQLPRVDLMNLLQTLDFTDNDLSGPIPSLHASANPVHIRLSKNQLTGDIPSWVSSEPTLQTLDLGENLLTGVIPSLTSLNALVTLNLGSNAFTPGPVPNVSAATNLVTLKLNNNFLTGTVPSAFSSLTKLQTLHLARNSLTGGLPSQMGSFAQIATVDVSENQFSTLPNFSQSANKANLTLNVGQNALDFTDMEPIMDGPAHTALASFTRDTQAELAETDEITVGDDAKLQIIPSVSAGAHGMISKWEFKAEGTTDWIDITNKDEDATHAKLILSNLGTSNTGYYRYQQTNLWVTGVTLTSEPIHVTVTFTSNASSYKVDRMYNGVITAIRWRTDAPYATNAADLNGIYMFDYDDRYQLKEAQYAIPGPLNTYTMGGNKYRVNNLTYDPNGNILSLYRFDKNGGRIHSFNYTYNDVPEEASNNQLREIAGYASYEYDEAGRLELEDRVTGEDQYIVYNSAGRATEIYGRTVSAVPGGVGIPANFYLKVLYTYDERGFRLAKTNYISKRTTWYIRDASGKILSVYETDHSVDDQHVTNQTEVPIYGAKKLGVFYPQTDQIGSVAYELTDQLGNVRAIVQEKQNVYLATMEDTGIAELANPAVTEDWYFNNVLSTAVTDPHMNHTAPLPTIVDNPNKASYLFWNDNPGTTANEKAIGPAMTLRVEPGDKITMEAFARYQEQASYSRDFTASLLGSVLGHTFVGAHGVDNVAQLTTLFQNAAGTAGFFGTSTDDTKPYAFLNYILFDKQMQFLDAGAVRADETGMFAPGEEAIDIQFSHLKFSSPVTITQKGYIYVWVSNESKGARVWFDDVKVVHEQHITTQSTDYDPWGFVMNELKTDDDIIYRYGYQGGFSEKDDETGWNHFEAREYDPVIGRWTSADPERQFHSPYLAMGNNPVMLADPNGKILPVLLVWAAKKVGVTALQEYGMQVLTNVILQSAAGQDMSSGKFWGDALWNNIDKWDICWNATAGILKREFRKKEMAQFAISFGTALFEVFMDQNEDLIGEKSGTEAVTELITKAFGAAVKELGKPAFMRMMGLKGSKGAELFDVISAMFEGSSEYLENAGGFDRKDSMFNQNQKKKETSEEEFPKFDKYGNLSDEGF